MTMYTQQKQVIRAYMLARRRSLTRAEVVVASERIAQRLFTAYDWDMARTVHIYASMVAWNEVETNDIIHELYRRYPRLSITVQGVSASSTLPAQKYDCIIVPVVAFDLSGNRIGMGKGWYDQFLATQPQAYTIGLAYSWARCTHIQPDAHDIPLRLIVDEANP